MSILEIGVQFGGSQQILKKYFDETASIYGIDIDERCRQVETGTQIFIGDATKIEFIEKISRNIGQLDIIIDDGSHKSIDQKKTFELLYPKLSEGGVYIVEDLEHSYFWKSGSFPFLTNTFWNYSKRTSELLNSSFRRYKKRGVLNVDPKTLFSIHFFPQIIAFHKLARKPVQICRTGKDYE